MNIMIANLSLISSVVNEYDYFWIDNEPKHIKGIQTNEAATKFFLWYLNCRGEKLDKILYMASSEVKEEKKIKYDRDKKKISVECGEDSISTESFYIERILEYCAENGYCNNGKNIEFIPVEINGARIPQKLIDEINRLEESGEQIYVYLDTTGGQRDDINRLQLLAKFLTYKGIRIEMPVYCNFGKHKIEKVDAYDMLDVLDGVSQFITTGQSTLLKKAIQSENKEIDELLETMQRFTNDIQLCRVERLDIILNEMGEKLNQLNDISVNKSKLVIFKQLIPMIREKFFGSNNSIGYPDIVKWCVENGFIQQALTIYVEMIPRYLFDNIIEYNGEKPHKDGKSTMFGTEEAEDLYSGLLSLYKSASSIDRELERCKEEYAKIKNNNKNKNGYDKNNIIIQQLISSNIKTMQDIVEKLRPYIDTENPNKFKLGDEFKAVFRESGFVDKIQAKKDGSVETISVMNVLFNEIGNLKAVLGIKEIEEVGKAKDKSSETISKKIATIKIIEKFIYGNEMESDSEEKMEVIKLRGDISVEEIRKILYDYVYVKAMRNMLNHASEKENITGNDAELYEKMGYGDVKKISLDELKSNIYRAIDRLTDAGERCVIK